MTTTALRIGPGDLHDPETIAFLEAHVAQLRATSPPESTHVLDLDGLRRPQVRFFGARDDAGVLVGCAALADVAEPGEPGPAAHVELKSMRTAPERRREGIASRLLVAVLAEAAAGGARRVSLETGSEEFFAPARALYARHGFVECEPFGTYRPDPLSTFMTRGL